MQYLLFVGSGFKRKGLATLTGLVYPEQNEEIHLIAAGRDKPDYYKNLQRTTGFQRQCFIGVQPDIENFAASDIFVLPTSMTLSVMLHFDRASGRPVIDKNTGHQELISNGQEGYIPTGCLMPESLPQDRPDFRN